MISAPITRATMTCATITGWRWVSAVTVFVLMLLGALDARAADYIETPIFAADVAAGKLPPVSQRVPKNPRRIDLTAMGREPGQHGGTMRILMGDQKDIRLMVVNGYSRLVGYNEKFELAPDILESFKIEDERVFTFKLRAGHKWSDGQPLTSEDFRYFWEDVATNDKLSPTGPPADLLAKGEKPKFEVIDALTVRYTWTHPNPRFMPALAGARPLYIMMPAHYLRQFHGRYRDKDEMAKLIASFKLQNWARLHERQSRQYRPENPALPSLDPWINTTKPPSTRFIFMRNAYYHRVDAQGRQLPYIDDVVMTIVASQLIPAKTASGEADLQARYLRFDNYTFLKVAERKKQFTVKLWERGEGAKVALAPNLTVTDPVWRALLHDVRVRRALSLAIDRREINQVIYYGLASESANTVLPASALFRSEYQKAWARLDIAQANRLLDAAGLDKRDSDGMRLLPDGRPANIVVETAGDSTEEADVLGLVRDTWKKIGLSLFARPTQRDLFRNRVFAGDTVMAMTSGVDNAIPTADMLPDAFVPTDQQHLHWSKWGLHYSSNGASGEPPEIPAAKELLDLYKAWQATSDRDERTRIWHKILAINAEQVFTIGIVNRALQPVVVSTRLNNVPEKGVMGFEPGAFFGMYLPDTFWFAAPTN